MISMQAACKQHASSMQAACNQYAISMQSACNHRDRLLLHSFEERLVLSACHLIELVDAAAALSGRTRCNQHAISMQSACNQQQLWVAERESACNANSAGHSGHQGN